MVSAKADLRRTRFNNSTKQISEQNGAEKRRCVGQGSNQAVATIWRRF